ncbi:hypothetical protein LP419_03755 [Massilia sp. H-1]|nr:hypothetical protein LP419_03755 [Massilia sp. H-1]
MHGGTGIQGVDFAPRARLFGVAGRGAGERAFALVGDAACVCRWRARVSGTAPSMAATSTAASSAAPGALRGARGWRPGA